MADIQTHFTDVFKIDPEALSSYGAFDISLINDLPLFIDPFLLFNSERDDYQVLHHEILRYLRFLRDASSTRTLDNHLIRSWFMFPEIRQNWLGFSVVGNRGSGLGIDFAHALHDNLNALLKDFGGENVTRSSHLEKACLIKDGVGRDNISDFTTNLIKGFLLDYTTAFAQQHINSKILNKYSIHRAAFNYETRSWVTRTYWLPSYSGDYVLLTPKDILTKEDTWINRADMIRQFHDVSNAITDGELRSQLNDGSGSDPEQTGRSLRRAG